VQALVVIHLRPARDLGARAMAAIAEAIVGKSTNADAGTENGAEVSRHWKASLRSFVDAETHCAGSWPAQWSEAEHSQATGFPPAGWRLGKADLRYAQTGRNVTSR
jgi:hypothetical protein